MKKLWPLLLLALAAGVVLAVLLLKPGWMAQTLGALTGATAAGATISRRKQRKELDEAVHVAAEEARADSQSRVDEKAAEERTAAESDPAPVEPPGMTDAQRAEFARLEAAK